MKARVITFLLLTLSMVAMAQKKAAVLDPICRDGSVNAFFMQIVRGTMENAISATDEYQAYDRTAFDKIIEEQSFQRSGAVNDSDIKQLGVMAGVDFILVPEVSAYEGYLSVNVKILNIETGRYDKTANEIVEMDPPKVKSVCNEMAQRMFGVANLNTGQRNGELQLSEGRYVGEFLDGKPHGKGTIFFKSDDAANRISYEGDWVNGKKNGKGKMIWKTGEVYEGNWINDGINGQGTMVYSNGGKYEGTYTNSKRNGQGTYYWANGDKYVGNWKDDKRSGYGIKYFLSGEWKGDRYEGYWENGMFNGKGTYYWSDGRKVVCNWKDDKRQGPGTFYYSGQYAGDKEEVYYENGVLTGKSTYYFSNGDILYRNYVNGKFDGEFIKKFKNGKTLKAKYSNGEMVRDWH